MSVGSVSSMAMREATRTAIARTQARLDETTREVASGRYHDIGLVLGARTAHAIEARQAIGDIDALIGANGSIASRLSVAQASLASLIDVANNLFTTALSALQSGADRSLFIEDARAKLGTLADLLSVSSGGAHVFGGLNASEPPLSDYLADPPPASRAAVINAFLAEFGFAPDDAGASMITPAQMQAYLGGSFAGLFQDPAWQSTFSSVPDEPTAYRISPQEIVTASFSANDTGIRRLTAALVAVVDSGTDKLNSQTFAAFAASIAEGASLAAGELIRSQASIGGLQQRVTDAGERMAIGRGLLERTLGGLENVDIGEASTRLNHLATQLEVTYAITARIQRLSILNYL